MWHERADYGHFFYRIPNGESAADAYDRVSHFNDSLWRRFGEEDFASVCILVTHGLMTRVFLMKWYHFSVEYFEDLRNVNHCEFVVMKKNQDNGKYILQNQLRTWSELKRERKARGSISATKQEFSPSIPTRRIWGGCPDGCNHASHGHHVKIMPVRQNTADLFKDEDAIPNPSPVRVSRSSSKRALKVIKDNDSQNSSDEATPTHNGSSEQKHKTARPRPSSLKVPGVEDIVSSPDGTPSYISLASNLDELTEAQKLALRPHLVHLGRDGGGSASGVASRDVSSEEEDHSGKEASKSIAVKPRSLARALKGEFGGSPRAIPGSDEQRVMADALGDQSDASVEEEDEENGDQERQKIEEDRILEDERRDRSLRGAVY